MRGATGLFVVGLVIIGCKNDKGADDRSAVAATGSQETPTGSAGSESPAMNPVVVPDADVPPPIDAAPPIDAPPSAVEVLLARPEYQYQSAQVDAFCRDKWSTRGELDVRMYNACERDQREGHAKLLALAQQHGDLEWVAKTLPYIWKKWTKRDSTNYEMVAAGLRDEVDAYKTYEYESKQTGADLKKLKRCLNESRAAYSKDGQVWGMTAFCYKER